jgi:DNA-directed RNA polymerase subunit N (RpoN/RPB10)|uniref:DNA-directed RNA polymerase subunit N n=1 Tax=viral metagenome TaxID=1070528 RepID=A0A6C0DQF0_9ZZZZ
MIIPIRCFTCSKVIADKYDYYHQEKNKLKADKKDDPNLKYFSDIHTKEILDNMGLIRYCCRRSVMSAVDLMDVI